MSRKSLKGVLMLVNDFPPLPSGGAERQAERLASFLVRQNVSVGVMTRQGGNLPWVETGMGFIVYRLPQYGFGKMKTVTFTISALIKLLMLNYKYDILHAHLAFSPAVVGVVAGRLLGKHVIVKFGNSGVYGDVQQSKKNIWGRMRLAILKRWANVIIILDSEMEIEVLNAGFKKNKILRMDNGVDTKEFIPVQNKQNAKIALNLTGKIVVLFTGRLAPQKALPVLLHALQKAQKTVPSLHLVLVGEGAEESKLRLLVKELSIELNVTFVGNVNHIRPYLDAADIFVLPSLAEGISNSLLEAMACGLACVSTPVGGSQDILGDGENGILIPVNAVDLLADTLVRLGLNPDERNRLGNKARRQVVNRYDIDVVGSKYLELYKSLVDAR